MKLSDLKEGKSAKILQIDGKGALRHHLLDMGLTPRTACAFHSVAIFIALSLFSGKTYIKTAPNAA